jgi:hypothetical protein
MMATNSSACPGLGVIHLAEALGLSPIVGAWPPSPNRVPGTKSGLPSLGEAPGASVGVSSSSQIEGLNISCMNTPGGGDLQLDMSRARASVASLPHRRM